MAVHSIGTGGDFSTPQAWEDDIPATLTEDRIGELKNQEFTGDVLEISAHTTTAGEIILRCQAGASFKDNANVRTNALRYNASNGAGFRVTGNFQECIHVSGAVDRLTVQDIQFKVSAGTFRFGVVSAASATSAHRFRNCIFETDDTGDVSLFQEESDNAIISNCLFIDTTSGSDGNFTKIYGTCINCTFVRSSNQSPAQTAIKWPFGITKLLKNCAFFGFTAECEAGGSTTSNNNATPLSDAGSALPDPGTDNNQYSVTYSSTSPFVNADASSAAHDFRLADNGNALINGGVLDATNAPNDISGMARNSPCEIGCWELAAAAAGRTTHNTRSHRLGTYSGVRRTIPIRN